MLMAIVPWNCGLPSNCPLALPFSALLSALTNHHSPHLAKCLLKEIHLDLYKEVFSLGYGGSLLWLSLTLFFQQSFSASIIQFTNVIIISKLFIEYLLCARLFATCSESTKIVPAHIEGSDGGER